MKFTDVLERYHISPLKYEDNTVLEEKDYSSLYDVLRKYFKMKKYLNNRVNEVCDSEITKKIDSLTKNSLIPATEEEIMDTLLNVSGKNIVLN